MFILEAHQLTKKYSSGEKLIEVLKNVSFSLTQGEFVAVMGPSGSGKSTLLHIIAGLERPTSGTVLVEGKNLLTFSDEQLSVFRRRRLGFIFQFFYLLPTLTVLENVVLPLLLDGQPFSQVSKRAKFFLEEVGLEDRMHHYSEQLSGGEMQRVAIARALVSDPVLILADEPTGNLDSKTGTKILELLAQVSKSHQRTVVMVTHDLRAASFGDRLIRFQDGYIESDEIIKKENVGLRV